jgi:hypothetical protein
MQDASRPDSAGAQAAGPGRGAGFAPNMNGIAGLVTTLGFAVATALAAVS